jgi:hypothetical protein
MAYGHEGFISLYENGDWLTGDPLYPQPLHVESESLGLVPDLMQLDSLVGASRASQGSSVVLKTVKPAGDIKVPLTASVAYKFLYSHFQYGSYLGEDASANQQWLFYPSKTTPSYESGARGNGAYGGTGYVFPISVLKKYNNKEVANAQWYKYGVVDKLEFSFEAEENATLKAACKFATYYNGTNIGTARIPGGTYAGEYASDIPFGYWTGTVLIGGVALELSSLLVASDNSIEEKTILGRQNPYSFSFGAYKCRGRFQLDMPDDGLALIGSQLSNLTFGVVGSFVSGTEVMTINMPYCRYASFDVLPNSQNSLWRMSVPFVALENGGVPPISVGIITHYGQDILFDAAYGARTLIEYELLDAEASTRTLGDFTLYDRDL